MRAGTGVHCAHALDCPEQIHRGRPGGGKHLAQAVKLFQAVDLLQLPGTECDTHSRSHADRWRTADHHLLNRASHTAVVTIRAVDLSGRQQPLVEHHHRAILPLDREKIAHNSYGLLAISY